MGTAVPSLNVTQPNRVRKIQACRDEQERKEKHGPDRPDL
jgi:hypothetical protein